MAAETFRIDIPVNVKDNTDPGISSASRKVSAFDKVVEKMQSRVDKATKEKWRVTIEAVDRVTSVISNIGSGIKSVAGKAWSITMSVIDNVTAPIKKMISVVGDLLGVSTAVSTVLAGLSIKNALEASAEASRNMTQLTVSAQNMGISNGGIQQIVNKAGSMQQTTMYSDDAMIGSAAELATYFSDADAITRMMDVVADYAAGMSGGTQLNTEQIVDYTTNLAKMTVGAYDAMTKKGFEVTDAQKAILESGTDMEKVAAIEEIIEENWAGMAEAMANTPTGVLTQMKNSWDDVSETIGNKLTPGVTSFLKMINSKIPAVSSILEDLADGANSWLEDFMPSLESWIDSAIDWVDNFKDKATAVFNSEEFQNADFFGKIGIAWNELIAEPFSEWWTSTGRAWFAEKASSIGDAIGSGITQGLLALLGIDISSTLEDGKSVGGAFIDGFKEGFDTEKIGEALKEWASNNKEVVIAIGAVIGFNLITGIAKKLNELTSLFNGKGSKDNGSGSSSPFNSTQSMTVTSTNTTVNGNIVNVYGGKVNDLTGKGSGGSGLNLGGGSGFPMLGGGSLLGKMLLGGGGSSGGGLLLGSGEAAGSAAAGTGEMIEMVELADGSFAAAGSGAAGAGGGAAAGGTALGAVATAASAIGGALMAAWGLYDVATTDAPGSNGEAVTMDDIYDYGESIGLSGLKTTAGGALIGTAIAPGLGTAIGAGVGVLGWGIGEGIKHWNDPGMQETLSNYGDGTLSATGKTLAQGYLTDRMGMDSGVAETLTNIFGAPATWAESMWGKIKEPLSTFFTETIPGFFTETIPNAVSDIGENIGTFFTETVPEFFENLWSNIYDFFAEDVPYAIGYAVGSIEVFFTETVPQFFSDLWEGITTFFTDTLPAWLSTIWEGITTFFTETIPQFFSDLWNGLVTFFTDTLPAWISGAWESISTFFTSTLPQWFSDLWQGIVTFFTETLPSFVSGAWEKITTFFTVTVPGWFSSLWDGIVNFVTNIIPTWVSAVGNVISGWGEAIAGWFSSLWSSIQSYFSTAVSSFLGGYSAAGGGKHAWGGIMNAPHYGLVAEDGPEAIIPLSPSKSERGLDLWMKAGQYLGVQPYAEGGIVGETDAVSVQTVPTGEGEGGGHKFEIIVTINPDFIIQAAGADEESIMATIREHLQEIADEVGGEIAEQMSEIFSNMPVKGGA